ncbi:MAG: double-strand break repair helicase AddA [Hyphomicrobiales bacterium]|nr:double-strand break repair helicase AddA [Hyphomicrobiales bacterium]
MSGRIIHETVRKPQYRACDPAASAWVSANAGSGKTYVLAQRVIRLLLDGTDPAKILCLTYTKAAAANMANRVFERLAAWVRLDDAALQAAIQETGLPRADAKRLAHARRLFAAALETPGGLKVQTIHAFCTRLLQQFPFEADVAAHFEVLEETQQRQMLESIRLDVLLAAAAHPDSDEGRALQTVITLTSDFDFQLALAEVIHKRDRLQVWLARHQGIERAMADLSDALGIAADYSLAHADQELLADSVLSPAQWSRLIEALERSPRSSDNEQAQRLQPLRTATAADRLDILKSVFCTKAGEPKRDIATKCIRDDHPQLCTLFREEQDRVCALLERRRAVVARSRTAALLTLAQAMIGRYRAEKEARGLLDYQDLIDKSCALLNNVSAAWVHYKLDLGIDHLLIDEAQDTSAAQWEIVERLVAEFTVGAGARGTLRRSLFAVGDDKQSIYSFQGADPRKFDEKRHSFRCAFENAGLDWRDVRLDYSFRSNDSVLNAVQRVFADPTMVRSVTADSDGLSPHLPLPDTAPGLVEIWPLMQPDERRKIEPWDAPFDKTSQTSPRVKLANRIARSVQRWIDREECVGSGAERHAVRPGDILVLVRQRGPLFEAIIRALKNLNIAVAGADRLMLTEHIAVMDLLALADALLLPDDDLALATVLKSPLFGLSEEELFELAYDRGRVSLRAVVAQRCPALAMRLDALASDAQRLSPFAFYARLLGAGARKRLLTRLGAEATDVLDEFLSLALAYESRSASSLQGFVHWLRTASAEIKRDMEIARDEVRVMTVHGAKGLEAPIVVLADTTTEPQGPTLHRPRLLTLPSPQGVPEQPQPLVWASGKMQDTPPMAAARGTGIADAIDEYRRLLYVAMTRAADRLIVCGAVGQNRQPQGCWYDLIGNALLTHCTEEPADLDDGTVWRFRASRGEPETPPPMPTTTPPSKPLDWPAWLDRTVPAGPAESLSLSPSQLHDETAPARHRLAARRESLARGVIIHRLLQSLPAIAPDARAQAARRYLAGKHDLTADERENLAGKVMAVIDTPRFAALFSAQARAEVPIVGRLTCRGNECVVAGTVDRLVVTDTEVLIADFKTNRDPPRTAAQVPRGYVAQLALYRAVLNRLYPDRTIRAALVWTEALELMEISAASLDAELAAVTSL